MFTSCYEKFYRKLGMAVDTCNPSTQQSDAGLWVQAGLHEVSTQPRIQRRLLSQKQNSQRHNTGNIFFLLFQLIPVLASSKSIEQGPKKYLTIDTLKIRSSSLSLFPAFLPSAGHIMCSIFKKTCFFYSHSILIIFHVVTYCL